ncbi:MAG TPA: LD-carboxypeptidase, partial [Bacteroidota bacterium]|nr:LD-carboxypeptidase [Bacteroidota bacterium]
TSVKAVFTVRGGYGSQRVLPLLDYRLIRRHPKILVGYSDITALQCALLAKIGLVTFSGPFVSGEMSTKLRGHAEELFWSSLMSPQPPTPIKYISRDRLLANKSGLAIGRLIGGNLSIISTLVGTSYFPSIRNPIYVLEDVGEQPYRIDRMLQHLQLSGIFSQARGIGLGNFARCDPDPGKPTLTLSDVVRDVFRNFQCPLISGLPVGHIKNSIPFPIGVRAQINGHAGTLKFLESGVH